MGVTTGRPWCLLETIFFCFPGLSPHGRGSKLLALVPNISFSSFFKILLSYFFCLYVLFLFFLPFFNGKLQKVMKIKAKKRRKTWVTSQEAFF